MDGQAYAGEGGISNLTIAREPADEFTIAVRITRGGKLWRRSTQVLAADGQRLTITFRGVDERISSIVVYDRVSDTARDFSKAL